ncbi:MAG TPA: galactose oxidase-like domain-containing protein, partial [Candidatus Eisenbacteria bacterium]|nr:galactose oxidase-like domain-containing protein [Candidatus Eisenbacteria bacterium]
DGIPVHFVLAPTDSGDDLSSQILWWNGGPTGSSFGGGLLLWHPPTGTMDAFANDTLTGFPTTSYVSEDIPGPGRNIFCASHTRLPDGRIFIAGGTDSGSFEVGINQNTIFDPHLRTWDVAAEPLPMSQRRWYANATTLPDGRVLISSGSKYFHLYSFGGSRSDSLEPNLVTRLGLAQAGVWDGQVSDAAGNNPERRELHTMVKIPDQGTMELFGGRDSLAAGSTPRNKNDVWRLFAGANTNGPDYTYSWSHLLPNPDPLSGNPPSGRYLHGAALTSAEELVVFGGVADAGSQYTVNAEVWVLRAPDSLHTYTWYKASQDTSALVAAGLHLGPRCGVAMWKDARSDSIFVYGGARAPDAAPTDSNVYSLKIAWTGTAYTATWGVMNVTSTASPGPRANMGSCGDPILRQFSATPGDIQTRGFIFGGRNANGALRSDLWQLWSVGSGSTATAQWAQVSPTATGQPGPRMNAALELEPEFDRLVLAGGDTTLTRERSSALWAIGATGLYPGSGFTPTWSQFATAPGDPLGAVSGASLTFWSNVFLTRIPEIYDYRQSHGAAFSSLSSDPHLAEWYPYMLVVPDASTHDRMLFEAGPRKDTWLLDVDGAAGAKWQPVDTTGSDTLFKGGSAVLYRVGAVNKVMKCGSRDTESGDALTTTASIDLTGSPSANRTSLRWQRETPMKYGRANENLVLLPTGDVIVFGGTRTLGNNDEDDTFFPFNFTPELWHPRGDASHPGAWDTLLADPFQYKRGYHSGAFLLPDGRVMTGGGNTLQDRPNAQTVQVYSPPYLYAADGTVLPRPKLLASQGRATYGDVLTFATDTTLDSLVLLRAAATTHAFNMEQRRIPVFRCTTCRTDSNATGYHEFTFQVPTDSAQAPPGDYMVFGLRAGYAPMVARWLRLANPRPTVDPGDLVHPIRTQWAFNGNPCDGYTLTWNAPADDSNLAVSGIASNYDARWTSSLTLCDTCWSAFRSATQLTATPTMLPPGSPQSMRLDELSPGFTYRLQMVAADDRRALAPSTSPLSPLITFHYNSCDNGLYAGGGGGGGFSLRRAGSTSLASGAAGGAALASEISALDGLAAGESRPELVPIPAPTPLADGLRVRLRHAGSSDLALTALRLLAVDADDSSAVLALPARAAAGRLAPATRIARQDGTDLTAAFQGDASPYHGFAGDTLLVTLPTPGGLPPGAPLPLRVRAAGTPPAGVAPAGFLVQVPASGGGWATVAHGVPHDFAADFAVDSVGATFVRLVLLTALDLAAVDRLVPGAAGCTLQAPALQALSDSRRGALATSSLAASGGGVGLSAEDTLFADFAALPPPSASRHWFLALTGSRATVAGAQSAAALMAAAEPLRFAFEPVRPNPFARTATLRFALPQAALVRLDVFDVQGRMVRSLVHQKLAAGWHALTWDRSLSGGGLAPPGIYLCRLAAGADRAQQRMVVFP